ncbi:tetratricopeptide repeat protein [Rubritalea tangerina]|uniref:Tetratricopeptide repeat protein n=1 Tax=Rubritalea tangerina TaxID=430798 RepID=A0ABW4ZEQ4_9BACT
MQPGDLKYAKPSVGIDGRPVTRPGQGGSGVRPQPRPGEGGAGVRPAPKPDRPNVGRPDRPNVGRPDRPDVGRPDRPSVGNPIAKPPIGNRPGKPGKPGRPGDGWGGNRPGVGHRPGGGNNINIGNKVDVNFSRNVNWSVDARHWGGRPWWGVGSYYPWHRGHWHYGWHYRPYYYRPGRVIAWGLVAWGVGNLIFDCGYHHYYNPYPTQTVVVYSDSGKSSVNYAQPVTSSAEQAVEQRSDMSQKESDSLAAKASAAFDEALKKFKQKDYLNALKKVDEAISYDPGETVQHEFKALCLFALKKYPDAAGVLNSVLSSNPGWGWDTMIGLYDASSTYEAQLRALEDYAKKSPKAADAQFLLGYHYMTAGYMEEAEEAFAKCVELQPRDQVAAELMRLTKNSSTGDSQGSADPKQKEYAPPALDTLHGAWSAKSGAGTIKLTIGDDNKFTWDYSDGKKPFKMTGTASMDDGLLVLGGEDSQIVAAIEMKDDKTLHFVIAGGPDGDPGLDFKKS